MSIFKTKNLALITFVYWFLLLYIVAALVWWFISLEQQNIQRTEYKLEELRKTDAANTIKQQSILGEKKRKTAQYVGEGVTFLAFLMIGAVFVYRATRRHLRLSMQQQNFMMAITHELKTPIAVTALNLETLQKRKLDEAQQQRLIANSLQETTRLNTLCNNILLASQLDSGLYEIAHNSIDLSMLANTCVADFNSRYPNRIINRHIQKGIYIIGEELLLLLMMNNLVENALKYSGKDKAVEVALRKEESIQFIVSDEGPGIDEKERKRIFEKFYRIGNESTRNAKGTGLGLYLVSKIAKDHKGKVSVKNNVSNGSIFTVSFNI
jgi:two-component system sensor histidine kinase CiaH